MLIPIGEPFDLYIGKFSTDENGVVSFDLESGGLTANHSGSVINNATITGTIKTTAGATVGAGVSMAYVAGSSGHYYGTIPAATTSLLTNGATYNVWYTSADGSVNRLVQLKAGYRGGN